MELTSTFSKKEIELFDKTIRDSKCYLEFGCGWSTIRATEYSLAKKIYSVESDVKWFDNISYYLSTMCIGNGSRTKIYHAYIGPTKEWGMPEDLDPNSAVYYSNLFPDYSEKIFSFLSKYERPDTILIDGRFRVACTLASILNCKGSPTIIIHDFTIRDYYHILLKYIDIVTTEDTMCIFKIKDKIDIDIVIQDYDKYKFNPL
jgi:hypothetical protein